MEKQNVEALLAFDKFNVDEENHHIELDDDKCAACRLRPCLYVCPAKCYTVDDENRDIPSVGNDGGKSAAVHFDYVGCLECGTCRISCRQIGNGAVVKWEYPRGTFGVTYRRG